LSKVWRNYVHNPIVTKQLSRLVTFENCRCFLIDKRKKAVMNFTQ
jgi:hypothetical protein